MADVPVTPGPVTPEPGAVTVRPAEPTDSAAVFSWRNDPVTRAASRNSGPVPWPVHEAWFAAVLADPERQLFVGTVGDEPIGVVRFDRLDDGRWGVSINLAPAARGRGLAVPLLRTATDRLRAAEPSAEVVAEIRVDNRPSRRAFSAAGYTGVDTSDGWSTYVLRAD